MNFVSLLAGFVAMVSVTSYGLSNFLTAPPATMGGAFSATWGLAAAALLMGVAVRTFVLAALVRATRGRQAIEWCSPGQCLSFADWVGTSWKFIGAGGRQEGLRVLGLGIAIHGHHGVAEKGRVPHE